MNHIFDPKIHHRHSIRLKGYDYSWDGVYFITFCSYRKESIFGEIKDGVMNLNSFGEIVSKEWLRTEKVRPYVRMDEFIVMPNHLHGILIIDYHSVGVIRRIAPTSQTLRSGSLGAIIGQIKSLTTKSINRLRGTQFSKVWQRNYYEHIIRNEDELNWTRYYIQQNPNNWANDKENPSFK